MLKNFKITSTKFTTVFLSGKMPDRLRVTATKFSFCLWLVKNFSKVTSCECLKHQEAINAHVKMTARPIIGLLYSRARQVQSRGFFSLKRIDR